MSQVSIKPETKKKSKVISVVLGICLIVMILAAYGQISILQKNTTNLQTNNNSLSNEVAALQAEKTSLLNQTAALEQSKNSLQQQVAALQGQVVQIKGENANLNSQMAQLRASIAYYQHARVMHLLAHLRAQAV